MYDTGRGVPEDDREAVRWYRLAADQGHVTAQFNLGVMHATGEGVPQDDREAVCWYRLAADQGDVDAQADLGFMYSTGRGVPQDDREAVRWYRLAAEQGHATARRTRSSPTGATRGGWTAGCATRSGADSRRGPKPTTTCATPAGGGGSTGRVGPRPQAAWKP